MLSDKMQQALNEQFHNEMYSAYLYLAMAADLEAQNLPGFATWMRKQSQEEIEHAMKFYQHIYDRGGRVTLEALPKPPAEFGSPLAAFQKALEHEKSITQHIETLYELALEEKDYPAQVMLQWFIEEQVEEEKTAVEIIEKLKMVGKHPPALLMMDHQLGERE